jgi:hypothetical protein
VVALYSVRTRFGLRSSRSVLAWTTEPTIRHRSLQDVAKSRVRPRTLDTYEAAITHHIVPLLGNRPLAKLTPQDCRAWIATLVEKGVSLGRIRYARVVLRNAHSILRSAGDW